jgi:integrase/recombinase XerD
MPPAGIPQGENTLHRPRNPWLRFLGWLDEPEHASHPHQAEIAIFENWLRQERGLSRATIRDCGQAADRFLSWLAGKGVPLSAVRMTDIDDVIAAEHERGVWCRRTIHDYAQRLKAFFRFAEARGWCPPGLAAGIMAPRFLRDETVPKGLRREDVVRLWPPFREIVRLTNATGRS